MEDVDGRADDAADGVAEDVIAQTHALLQQAHIPGVAVTFTETINFHFGSDDVSQEFVAYMDGKVSQEHGDALAHLVEQLQTAVPDILINCGIGAGVGSQLPDIDVLELKEQAKMSLAPFVSGELTLLDVWTTDCEPCLEALSKYDTLFAEHPEWKGHLSIVTLCVDETSEGAVRTLESLNCQTPVTLWANAEEAAHALAITSLPCWILLHKGEVVWRGHPADINVDETLAALIDAPSSPSSIVENTNTEGALGPVDGVPLLESLDDDEMLQFLAELQERVARTTLPSEHLSCIAENTVKISPEGQIKNRKLILVGDESDADGCLEIPDWIQSVVCGNVFIAFSS